MGCCHGTLRELMAPLPGDHVSAEGRKRFTNPASSDRSIPHPEVVPSTICWCVFTSVSELVNNKVQKPAGAGRRDRSSRRENMAELGTWWSPGGELRWAVYDFMNVPLEVFSLPCINLSSLSAAVELGDAFVFRHSSDLHSTAALSTPYTSSPTVKHSNYRRHKTLSTLTRIYIKFCGFKVKMNIFVFIIYLFTHEYWYTKALLLNGWQCFWQEAHKYAKQIAANCSPLNSFAPWINGRSDSCILKKH